MAAQIGQQEIVTLLLAHGANPTLTTKVNMVSASSHHYSDNFHRFLIRAYAFMNKCCIVDVD